MRSTDSPVRRTWLPPPFERSAFPAAVVEVGDATRPLWRKAFGRLTYDETSSPATDDTIFDLASLTKVLATTPLVMQQVERGALGTGRPGRTVCRAGGGAPIASA